ncbi:MAG: hypothetical protein ACI841_005355, partial [Planctomycetota bacterium]
GLSVAFALGWRSASILDQSTTPIPSTTTRVAPPAAHPHPEKSSTCTTPQPNNHPWHHALDFQNGYGCTLVNVERLQTTVLKRRRPVIDDQPLERQAFIVKSIALILALAAGLSGCKSTAKQSTGPAKVHDLLGRIERVHVESQMSQEAMRLALTKLHMIVKPGFEGDPVAGYNEYVQAFRASEEREKQLVASSAQMKSAAEPYFARWLVDLRAYTSPEMRLRSRARLTQTRERFEVIVAALEPTQYEFHNLNQALRDHAIFLAHDFNETAVAQILDQVQAVTVHATQLDKQFEECFEAARAYVEVNALPTAPSPKIESEEEPAVESVETEAVNEQRESFK